LCQIKKIIRYGPMLYIYIYIYIYIYKSLLYGDLKSVLLTHLHPKSLR
jgi:hypothetical protein